MISFPAQPGVFCASDVSEQLPSYLTIHSGGGDSSGQWDEPPVPEDLGIQDRETCVRAIGSDSEQDNRKACWLKGVGHAGFYSQFILFFLLVREQIQASKQFFPIEH